MIVLLTRMLAEIDALWNEVTTHNRAQPIPDDRKTRVSFYFGQHVQDGESASLLADHRGSQTVETV